MVNYGILTNEELFKLIARKDRGVFEFIYDKYAAAVYGTIVREIKLTKHADDILLQTFTDCFNLKFPFNAYTTIFRYLQNTSLDYIKKRKSFSVINPPLTIPFSKMSSVKDTYKSVVIPFKNELKK